jgi:hypothetical protein
MKWMLLDTDYPEFLASLYAQNPGLEARSYDEQLRARNDSLFGTADFYSANLQRLGHEAIDVHTNNAALQRAWALEAKVDIPLPPAVAPVATVDQPSFPARVVRRLTRSLAGERRTWLHDVLLAQARAFKPDVILHHDPFAHSAAFMRELRHATGARLVIGQKASVMPRHSDVRGYDLMLTSFPHFVSRFRELGTASELFRLGFEPRVLERVAPRERDIAVSFIGSMGQSHSTRARLLAQACASLDLSAWGPSEDYSTSSVRACHRGEAWGRTMYERLSASRVTINRHIEVAGSFANNMRLFEATGMGALLITDAKTNLHEMFEPGREVVTYSNTDECIDLVRHYVRHDDDRARIAAAGQRRTLRDHTYELRMAELVDIASRYL